MAKSQDEWPSTWDESAFLGTASNGRSWMECVHVSQTINDASEPVNPSAQVSTLSKRNISPKSLAPPCTSSSSRQIEYSITVEPPPRSSSQRTETVNTPSHTYDRELTSLSKKLNLQNNVVLAAKQIISRVEKEPRFLKQCRNPNKNSFIIVRVALFEACRQLRIPKTFKQFELDLPRDSKLYFHKIFKIIDSILKNNASTNPVKDTDSSVSITNTFPSSFSTGDFISSQVKTMGLSDAIRDRAIAISKCVEIENFFVGRIAHIAAAVILSFAAEREGHYLGNALYAKAADVSTSTIASSQKELLGLVEEMSIKGVLPPPMRVRRNYWNIVMNTLS